jgi:two-component system cell cycle response regulator
MCHESALEFMTSSADKVETPKQMLICIDKGFAFGCDSSTPAKHVHGHDIRFTASSTRQRVARMSTKRTFTVAVIGLTPQEQSVLTNCFRLSTHRPFAYTQIPFSEETSSDLVIVDGDDEQAMTQWYALHDREQDDSQLVTCIVSQLNIRDDNAIYHIPRPLLPSRVLKILDQAANDMQLAEAYVHRALIVDDSQAVRTSVQLELKKHDILADCAENSEQALNFLNSNNQYDIIFLDVILPGIDGYHLCKTIKKNKQRKYTPIVMLTGKSSPFDRVRGKLSGCDTYLTKPVSRGAFQEVVQKYLSQAKGVV